MDPVAWTKSNVLRAFITIAVTQVVSAAAHRWKIDISVYGITVNEIVEWLMNLITGLAIYYGTRSRVTQPMPPIKGSRQDPTVIPAPSQPETPK